MNDTDSMFSDDSDTEYFPEVIFRRIVTVVMKKDHPKEVGLTFLTWKPSFDYVTLGFKSPAVTINICQF
ncbi:12837_t:CDS:2 [Funneliformis geosporum]|nr:12837_t:CDS:2 [Funneliformis geosporum]